MTDAIEISGRRAVTFSLSTSIANSGVLEKGEYDIVSDVDCSVAIERGTPSPALTTANGYPLFANQTIPFRVGEGQAIYAIAGGAGTLKYIKTGN
jgi:hypothetical protein